MHLQKALSVASQVSRAEFEKYLSQFRYTASAAAKVYEALDMDNCGEINLNDLQEGLAEYCQPPQPFPL